MESEDQTVELHIDESDAILIINMDFKKQCFEQKIQTLSDGKATYTAVTKDGFFISKGDEKKQLASASWDLIAHYGFSDNAGEINYYWMWAWESQNEASPKIQEALKQLPENMAIIAKKRSIIFSDPMFISYMQSFLCEKAPYDYMFIQTSHHEMTRSGNEFSVMGIFDIEWNETMEVLEPDFSDQP
jgi:hypothetical protein